MATVSLTTAVEMTSNPWLVRKLTVSTGTTGAAVNHGGPGIPDLVIIQPTLSNPTASEGSVTAKSTTTVTLDFENDSGTADVYCIWFFQASGGITAS